MRPMRRQEKKLSCEHAESIIDKCDYFVLATVDAGGEPYCVPLSMARNGEWLYFHSATEGHKIDNLKINNKVCVSCVGDFQVSSEKFTMNYESVIIFGTAEEITSKDEKVHALKIISQRWTPNNMANFDAAVIKSLDKTAVWKIHIDEMSVKGGKK